MAREIKVLGTGCQKCEMLYENVIRALEDLNIEANVIKIKDLMQISAHGVITTPALIIDGKLISQGKLLGVEEIKELLK